MPFHSGRARLWQQYSLSSRVRCSARSVSTLIFSRAPRGRRGFIRLTAAVLRNRLARPRVGELSQAGLARAPPMARAAEGRWDWKEMKGETVPAVFGCLLLLP